MFIIKNIGRIALARVAAVALMAVASLSMIAQIKVSGVVTDAKDGEPLYGVTVLEKGTSNGISTGLDGDYTLTVAEGKTITFSYLGYKPVEKVVTGPTLDVALEEDIAVLDEVVVIGYGHMQRKDLTGSISTVNAKDLNVGAYTDPGQLLQGKVPGLVVVQNSDPNGGVNSMTLRGASTLNGSTAPLYVVDGIPGVELNLIPPSDIESIDVLRDASATAIYGSKAANGVIIVTTKRGADGPARVTYSGYTAWEWIANDHKMMSADQLRSYAAELGVSIKGDEGASTNWAKQVQRTGFAHNHTLSISGGNAKTNYMASLNYIARDGIITGAGNNLFTARAYVETKVLKDRLTLAAGINGNIRNEWGVARGGLGNSVYQQMYTYNPCAPVYADEDQTKWYNNSSLISQSFNPLALIYEDQSRATFKRYQVTGKASLKIIEGLLLNANFSYQTNMKDFRSYSSHESQIIPGRNGQVVRDYFSDYNKLMEIYANYDKQFGLDHKLALMAGYSWEQNNTADGYKATGYDFYDDSLWWNNIGAANKWDIDPVSGHGPDVKRMISFYGRANYSFKSKYLFQAAVRRDGASTFGSNNKWATFPSASVAWRISEEDFLKNLGVFNDLKIRAGWGQSGNSAGFDAYASRFFYDLGGRFDYDGDSYKEVHAARNVNDDLKWETTTMLNLGIDFAFFNGRLSGTIEYYNKDTKDMIWNYAVSTLVYPVGNLTANVGRMRNRGVELSINAVPVQTRDFQWSSSLNFSHNDNKVVSISNPGAGFNAGILDQYYNPNLPGASSAHIQRIIEGQPIGTFYMWEWAGYNERGNSCFYVYDKTREDVFGERLRDENGNFVTTETPEEKDRVIVGNAQPKLTMGWNNTFTWKNWDLNIFFTGVFGQKIFNEPRAALSNIGDVAAGKNILADTPNFQKVGDSYSSMPSDRWLEDGSYFKLSTATLGYTFRNCFNGWLSDIRLYVSANNVFTITKYKGRDPELCLDGLTPGCDTRTDHYPRARQLMVGVNVNF
ncbi:MAG: TonB-dependent receptor [Muribaculaceae bacterium]|nr:TonB-dependent receptor [Muribaculaceae bacterium]